MDLYGRAPEQKPGRLFIANAYWWQPMVEMLHQADDTTARRCPTWWMNDGQGLDRTDAKTLGSALRQAVERGAVEETAQRNSAAWQESEETRLGRVPARWETQDERGNPYRGMNRERTLELADFLENCGGFNIW
jgi:hypothetical protein